MNILTISGSLRAVSSNTAVLEAAAMLAPPGVVITRYDALAQLPFFNPDLDLDADTPPQIVQEFREKIGACDGLVICSPEYAHGVAGAMKNALDWLVSSVEFPAKPVALINASPRATLSFAQLRETLLTMSARVVEDACITLPQMQHGLDAPGIAADPELAPRLREAMQAFVDAIAAMPAAVE